MGTGKVVVVEGPDLGMEVVLDQPNKSYIMGRGKGTEIKLTDIQSSRTHAMFIHKGDKFVCSDLQSRNGTIVNGKVIEGEYELEPGDRVTVGATTVEFQRVDETAGKKDMEKEATAAKRPAVPAAAGKAAPGPAKTASRPASAKPAEEEVPEAEGEPEPMEVTPLESGITNVVRHGAMRDGADRPAPTAAGKPARGSEAEAPPPARISSKKTDKLGALPGKAGKRPIDKVAAKANPRARDVIPSTDSESLENLDQLDKVFAQMAIDAEYVTESQVAECSRVQKDSANRVSLGMILVEKGYMDLEGLSHICELRGPDALEEDDVIKSQDFLFGRLCVQLGLISPNQLNECMMLQGKKTRDGEFRLLGAIMVEKAFLSEEKVRDVLRIHRTEMLHCHGCDALYKAADVAKADRDRCVECGASLKSS